AVVALAGLRGQEERVRVAAQPGGDVQFGVAVSGGHVDLVDAVGEQHIQRTVGVALGSAAERGRAEDRTGRVVTGSTERHRRNHGTEPIVVTCVFRSGPVPGNRSPTLWRRRSTPKRPAGTASTSPTTSWPT